MMEPDTVPQQLDDDTLLVRPEHRPKGWQLKKLKPLHKDVCSYIAQGMKQIEVASICGITKEYVWMLLQQPLCQAYIQEMNQAVGVRLEAMFSQTVDTIAETMRTGSPEEQLKAARLQLEATRRIGAKAGAIVADTGQGDRLLALSERLVGLLAAQRNRADGQIIEGEFRDASFPTNASQPDGC